MFMQHGSWSARFVAGLLPQVGIWIGMVDPISTTQHSTAISGAWRR